MITAIVTRDPKPRKGLPAGFPGQVRSGFEFYLNKRGKKADLITIEISKHPILYAVTDEQEALWQGAFAVPMKRQWVGGMWTEFRKKRKRTVEDRYHWLEFEKPGRHKPWSCRSHVLKAVLKRQNRLIRVD